MKLSLSQTILYFSSLVIFLVLFFSTSIQAHRLRPAVVNGIFDLQAGTYHFEIKANMEAILAEIGPEHQNTNDSPNAPLYNELRKLEPEEFEKRIRAFESKFIQGVQLLFGDSRSQPSITHVQIPTVGDIEKSRVTTVTLGGSIPKRASSFIWSYSAQYGNNVLKLSVKGKEIVTSAWLKKGERSKNYDLGVFHEEKTVIEIAIEYTMLGFSHIVPLGLDHMLFVLGIFFLNNKIGPVLWQVTSFTLAHSVTLALSTLGILEVPSSIVEPLIAVSIAWVGIENVFTTKLSIWRVAVVFAFGLLHGLGFAGVLGEIGLPADEFITALITFNVGVEFGQLSVILVAFLAVTVWFGKKPWYRARIVIPASLSIAVVGIYWAVERTILS